MKKIADDFRDVSSSFSSLAQMTRKGSLSVKERDAAAFALKALQFALQPETMWQFNNFLINWPRDLTEKEETRLRELERDISQELDSDSEYTPDS